MKPHGDRAFFQVPENVETPRPTFSNVSKTGKKPRSKSSLLRGNGRDLIHMIEMNIIGKDTVVEGPFGARRAIYMDHTASGQSLKCIEEFVRDHVLPFYSNTHTTGTLTSAQTTLYRHEARDIVRNAVGASEHDVVIFCGSGATGPIHKLVNALTGDPSKPPPIVFLGPFEHHSNILPWRDIGAKVITIPETATGELDIEFLEKCLQEETGEGLKKRQMIGSFSVASNVTGASTDDVAVTVLLHKYGALSLWDYSAAAPHAQIVMNPIVINADEQGLAKKDALFFSGHKFVGGPQTPGVLIAKNVLFETHAPNGCGGGTIFFVTDDSHRYLKNTEYREEGGTPAIVESIRLGLVFKLKETIGAHNIISREASFVKKLLNDWSKVPEIRVLGSTTQPRIPIVSFLIEHPESGYYLHHNYVVVLLNDLFGIQSRGGCACAGPYGESLLGIDLQLAHDYEALLLDDSRLDREHLRRRSEGSAYELFRPGFVRLSIPYYSSGQEAEFVSEAVQLVAKHGWKLLPLYTCNPETGEFHHHQYPTLRNRRWLSWATYNAEGIRCKERTRNNSEDSANFSECLEQAKNIFENSYQLCRRRSLPNQSLIFDSGVSHLKWFLLPSEGLNLHNPSGIPDSQQIISPKPFQIKTYSGEKQQSTDSVKYYPYSIPYQIMQSSAWTGNGLNLRRSFDQNSLENNDSLNSSSNESDNEYTIPGATVTGPSICFSGSSLLRSDFKCSSPVSEPTISKDQLAQVDLENNNNTGNVGNSSSQNIVNTPAAPSTSIPQQQHWVINSFSGFNELNSPTTNVVNSSMANSPMPSSTVGPCGGTPQMNYNNYEMAGSNTVVQDPNYQPQYQSNTNYGSYQTQTQPTQFSFSPTPSVQTMYSNPVQNTFNSNQQFQNNQPVYTGGINGGMSGLNINVDTTQNQQSMGYYPQNGQNMAYYSPVMTPTTPGPGFGCSQIQQQQQPMSGIINGGSSPEMHCGYCPSTSPAPIYYQNQVQAQPQQIQQQQNYQTNTLTYQQDMSTPYNVNVTSSSPLPNYNNFNAATMSPAPGSPVFNEEFVNMAAMRRATDVIANELKSEIREVISQVEQVMDPDGMRERANSFNSKDKRLDRLRRRERTLSGQLLNGNFKKSESEDSTSSASMAAAASASFARSKTIDAIWNSTDFTKHEIEQPLPAQEQMATATTPVPKGKKAQKKLKGGTTWQCPPKNILKQTLGALNDFPMIQNGDRLLVCLSGGKDSLSLLHTIRQVQFILAKKGISFEFGAVTVDPGSSSYNPKPLIPYLEALGVPYFYEEQGIMPTALEKGPDRISSICSFCSRLKRGRIYATAREHSYNVLALGQHLDDLAESFLMSVFHNGFLRTMKACYTVKEGDLRVIRPFINVREKSLRDFAESRGLPIIPENCPACFDAPTERHRVKQLLAQQEILFPKLYLSLRSAMGPLMAINKTGMESGAAVSAAAAVAAKRTGLDGEGDAATPDSDHEHGDDNEEMFCK